jgi:hypothetical protein
VPLSDFRNEYFERKEQDHKASGRYANGHKRCQICDLFIKWYGVFCPCCGSRLRMGPRNIKDKAKIKNKTKRDARI